MGVRNVQFKGSTRRGGNGFGPPSGAKPVHPDNRENAGRKKPDEAGSLGFHDNLTGANIDGDFSERVRNDLSVVMPDATGAGARHGAYNSGRIAADSLARQNDRRLQADDVAYAQSRIRAAEVADSVAQNLMIAQKASSDIIARSAAAETADRDHAQHTRARKDRDDLLKNQRLKDQDLNHKEDLAALNLVLAERALVNQTRPAFLQAQLNAKISTLVTELQSSCSEEVMLAKDAEAAARHRFLRDNMDLLRDTALREHELNDLRENGKIKPTFSLKPLLTFVDPEEWADGRPMSSYNPAKAADANYARCVMVELVPGILFYRRGRTSWASYLAGGLATCWKRTISVYQPNTFTNWTTTWVAPTAHRIPYRDRHNFIGSTSLLHGTDRRVYRSILDDYRFLGFRCQMLFDLMNNSEDFIRANGFTHSRAKWVHPTLYQEIMSKMVGVKMTINVIDQVARDVGKNWSDLIPQNLIQDTIALACQHTAIFNHERNMTAPKTKKAMEDF